MPEEYTVDYGMIGRGPRTTKLYEAEERMVNALSDAATELAKLKGWTEKDDLYNKAIPSELYTLLDKYGSGFKVAKTFIEVQKAIGRAPE